jgi:phosphoglucosamine mutase
MKKLFGTDGIRAIAGEFPLNRDSIYALGKALVKLLQAEKLPPKTLIGRDTRESGSWMEEAIVQGVLDADGEAISAGIIPTSAVSFLTKKHVFSAGIVISASHNPYQDNGIKIFSSEGFKISDAWEARLEKDILDSKKTFRKKITKIRPESAYLKDYKGFLKSQLANVRLPKKFKVVLDCSNGASSHVAPEALRDLGFDVVAISHSPNGKNINDGCGSLYPEKLAKTVVKVGGDIGIAYDGDADRVVWVDEKGRILNGDHTLFVLARFMKNKGRLKSDMVVATTMSNMGLELALAKMRLKLIRTKVGDKYVLEKMIDIRTNLGGEQSGHTIFLDDCPTGDGILTSLKMLEVLASENRPFSELMEGLQEYPQLLVNVPVVKKVEFKTVPEIGRVIDDVERELEGRGRLNVRYSGTELLARVMVEAQDSDQVTHCAKQVADMIAKHLGKQI